MQTEFDLEEDRHYSYSSQGLVKLNIGRYDCDRYTFIPWSELSQENWVQLLTSNSGAAQYCPWEYLKAGYAVTIFIRNPHLYNRYIYRINSEKWTQEHFSLIMKYCNV